MQIDAALDFLNGRLGTLKISLPDARFEDQSAPELADSVEPVMAIEPTPAPAAPVAPPILITPPTESTPTTTATISHRPEPRPETDFEKLDRTLKQLLSRIRKKKGKADLRDVADIAILSDFNVLCNTLRVEGHKSPEIEASLLIARCKSKSTTADGNPVNRGEYFARQLRRKARHVRDTGLLPERRQGKGARHHSLLDFEDVARAVDAFFGSTALGEVRPTGPGLLLGSHCY